MIFKKLLVIGLTSAVLAGTLYDVSAMKQKRSADIQESLKPATRVQNQIVTLLKKAKNAQRMLRVAEYIVSEAKTFGAFNNDLHEVFHRLLCIKSDNAPALKKVMILIITLADHMTVAQADKIIDILTLA